MAKEDVCHAKDGGTLGSLDEPRQCFTKKKVHPKNVCYQITSGNVKGYGDSCKDGSKPAEDVGLKDGKGWCCFVIEEGTNFTPPNWMAHASEKLWCTGAALAV